MSTHLVMMDSQLLGATIIPSLMKKKKLWKEWNWTTGKWASSIPKHRFLEKIENMYSKLQRINPYIIQRGG